MAKLVLDGARERGLGVELWRLLLHLTACGRGILADRADDLRMLE